MNRKNIIFVLLFIFFTSFAAKLSFIEKPDSYILKFTFKDNVKSYFSEKKDNIVALRLPEKVTSISKNKNLKFIKNFENTANFFVVTLTSNYKTKIYLSTDRKKLFLIIWKNNFIRNLNRIKNEILTAKRQGKKVVLIDPGHGGKDPGVVYKGIMEKTITLALAQKVKEKLTDYDIVGVLTRTEDLYISLIGRLEIIWQTNPDCFLSLHVNYLRNPKINGIEIFYLSNQAAKDKELQMLVSRENNVEGFNTDLADYYLKETLLDLQMASYIKASAKLVDKLYSEFNKRSLTVRKIKRSNFAILKSLTAPSALIEVGFISNPIERNKLTSRVYHEILANAISSAVDDFFSSAYYHPTTSIKQEKKVNKKSKKTVHKSNQKSKNKKIKYIKYIVKKGDTLYRISRKFKIPIDTIVYDNGLENYLLKEGQVLWIRKK